MTFRSQFWRCSPNLMLAVTALVIAACAFQSYYFTRGGEGAKKGESARQASAPFPNQIHSSEQKGVRTGASLSVYHSEGRPVTTERSVCCVTKSKSPGLTPNRKKYAAPTIVANALVAKPTVQDSNINSLVSLGMASNQSSTIVPAVNANTASSALGQAIYNKTGGPVLVAAASAVALPRRVEFPIPLQPNTRQPKLDLSDLRPDPATPSGEQPSEASDESAIRLNTILVTTSVRVLTHGDRFIPDLTPTDFHIYEDNQEQQIDKFETANTPFYLILLLDTSGSTQSRLADMQHATEQFIEMIRPQDQVMIVTFDDTINVYSEFTSDKDTLREAIYRTRTGDGTRLYDSVFYSIASLFDSISGRKGLVLLTDGEDTASSFITADQTLDLVIESSVLVYPIYYFTRYTSLHYSKTYLRQLAENSGARYEEADSLPDLHLACSRIAQELGQLYSLSYYPKNYSSDGTYRRIRVKVDKDNVAVQARKGYRAPGGSGIQDPVTRQNQTR